MRRIFILMILIMIFLTASCANITESCSFQGYCLEYSENYNNASSDCKGKGGTYEETACALSDCVGMCSDSDYDTYYYSSYTPENDLNDTFMASLACALKGGERFENTCK